MTWSLDFTISLWREKLTTALSPFIRHTTQFLAIPFLAHLTVTLEQILPPAALRECFWEATCPEGKVDTKVLEDWQNNLRAQLVREEDGCNKTEDCRFSFQGDTSLEKLIRSLIKRNPAHTSTLCFEHGANTETGPKQVLLWSVPQIGALPVFGDSHETSSVAVPANWLLDNLNLGSGKAAWAMLMLTSPGDADPPAHPAQPCSTKSKNSTTEKHWHHSPMSHCCVSLALEWIQTVPAAPVICWISSALLPIPSPLHSGSPPDPPPLEPSPLLFPCYWQFFFVEPVLSIFCLKLVPLTPPLSVWW